MHRPEGVENGLAGGPRADDGVVLDGGQVRLGLEGGVEAPEGHDHARRLNATRRPDVPAEPDAVPVFVLLDELLVGRHGWIVVAGTAENVIYPWI